MRKVKESYSTFDLVSVSDIKQYFYCPRVIYYMHALGLRERQTYSMNEGKEVHQDIRRKEARRLTPVLKRRFGKWKKVFGLRLYSERLGLSGVLDVLLIRGKEYVPMEYKVAEITSKRPPPNHFYQLVAYALLVEDRFNVLVRKGFIYYHLSDRVLMTAITSESKKYIVRVILPRIRMIMKGSFPYVKAIKKRCRNCG
ncbi:MAG TPA: CRISPR-associated protein Cas4, partial [Thermofilum sp.]|nr:CRISPR-associated protein Cas4 [Thermofilum sp.]